ncbi:MAG: AbrB/MazE/SpoVT family DNA-binding domain-containing protein [Candidatus Bathyarchaeia archaeon]|nr:AbrB/MazE/SpoVT family DNA-binding domain-containing protein [Candidatus Bathyarchaeota archaeon]
MAVVIDRYGRVLIPKEVRGRLGLKPNTALELIVKGGEIVLRPRSLDLEGRIDELSEYLMREAPEAFVNEPCGGDSKWLSRSYCLRKLGLSKE